MKWKMGVFGVTKIPYDHQEKAIYSLFDYWSVATGNPLVTAPTGSGKSLILAEFIKRACELYPGTRILVLTHIRELLQQNAQQLAGQWPTAPFGFYSAGLGRRDAHAQILFAGIQSIHSKAALLGHVDLVLIDEAHLLSPNQNTMYRRFLSDLKSANPYLKVGGLTATPFRADSGYLIEGKNALFTDIIFEIPILYLIENGYLCPVVTPKVDTKMDVTGVGTRAGDYIPGQLERAVDKDEITVACVDEIIMHGHDRKTWLIFCAGIDHANHTADEIRARGVSCEVVTGDTPNQERDKILQDLKTGKLRSVVNVAVLTTGVDIPAIDLIAFMRPTRSPVLYIQCTGRGMRTHPDKENCLILDFGGVVDALGPIDNVNVPKPSNGNGDAPIKQCPECLSINHAAVRECAECGYQFPEPEPKVNAGAANGAILSNQIEASWVDVQSVSYARHPAKKEGKPDTICVTYNIGMERVREWLCPEHLGYARTKFCKWWIDRGGGAPPNSIDEALSLIEALPRPSRIEVRPNGKYNDIISYDDFKLPEIVKEVSELDDEIPF